MQDRMHLLCKEESKTGLSSQDEYSEGGWKPASKSNEPLRRPPPRNPYQSTAPSYTPTTAPLTINTETKIEVESGNPTHPDDKSN